MARLDRKEVSPFTHGEAEEQVGVQFRHERLKALLLQCSALNAAETAGHQAISGAIFLLSWENLCDIERY